MNNLTILLTVLCAVNLSACTRVETQPPVLAQIAASPPPTPKPDPSPSPSSNQPIRSIDFANVSYPRYPVYTDERKQYVTLKAGEGAPAYLNYGDVTGDGIEEAMAVLGIDNHGSAIPEIVYIFGLEKGRPNLLWSFETGDRADGGVRQVYADNGELIIELYGKERVIGSNLYRGDEGLCCPSSFTRARYEWRGNRFQLKGKPEVLPNPAGHASSVMPYYSPLE